MLTGAQLKEVMAVCDLVCERLETADIYRADLVREAVWLVHHDLDVWDEALRILSELGWDADRMGTVVTVRTRSIL